MTAHTGIEKEKLPHTTTPGGATSCGRFYRAKLHQKGVGKARVAVGRKLGIRLWILLRDQIDYVEFCRRAPSQSTAV
jgi:hypothetical protein